MPNCPVCDHANLDHDALAGCLAMVGETEYCDCTETAHATLPETIEATRRRQALLGEAARDAAMATVEENTAADWVLEAEAAVAALAVAGDQFSADDVWDLLAARGIPGPHNPSALGPVMRRAIKDGVARMTGFGMSRRPERHRAPVRLYVGGQA